VTLLSVWVLNVGQGDSIVVRFPDGTWGVVDSNVPPGEQEPPALAFLRENGVTELAFVCLTHPHYDHYLGLQRILESYAGRVTEFWAFNIDSAHVRKFMEVQHSKNATTLAGQARYSELQAVFRTFRRMEKAGAARRLVGGYKLPRRGVVEIDCLSPLSQDINEYQTQLARSDPPEAYRADENLLSAVLSLRYGSSRIVLSSDAPTKAWPRMWKEATKRKEDFRAVAVKVSHHGSKQGFHEEVWKHTLSDGTTHAAISAGVGYGHPHPRVIESLYNMGASLHCTNFPEYCLRRRPADLSKFEGLPERSKLTLIMLDQSNNAPLQPCNGNIRFDLDGNGGYVVGHDIDSFCPLHLPTGQHRPNH
jgi:beta-lactamase superfamily II metal-dependent hydrolase